MKMSGAKVARVKNLDVRIFFPYAGSTKLCDSPLVKLAQKLGFRTTIHFTNVCSSKRAGFKTHPTFVLLRGVVLRPTLHLSFKAGWF